MFLIVGELYQTSVWLEWIKLPAYEVIDEEYKVFGHSIHLTALPSINQRISVNKVRNEWQGYGIS